MFGEFIFPYQLPFLEKFELNRYVCCEPLDTGKYILSWKPSPAGLAVPVINEKGIRDEIRRALEITRGCHVEILMKDNHTIGNNPQNVIRWVEMVREVIDRFSI